MRKGLLTKFLLSGIFASLFSIHSLKAQLNTTFKEEIFDHFLIDEIQLSPGNHGNHFRRAAGLADSVLAPALNSLIGGNVSSFPLSSTSVGVSFDFSTGQPVSIVESLGPIFAETGRTLGKGKINAGVNYTYLNLSDFRGIKTEDMRFTFTHVDLSKDGTLGENVNESDIMDVTLGLDVNASIFAFFATMGITKNLDIGVAIPTINVSMEGDARAVINSFTLAAIDTANHHFGEDPLNPKLESTRNYKESASGIGDLTVRLKYSFAQGKGVNLAALLDVRLPTGDPDDFLGAGETNVRLMGILSKKFGDFTPHLNMGYDYRRADTDSDEFEFAAGFDQKLLSGLTFAIDILGEVDLNKDEAISLFPGSVTIVDRIKNDAGEEIGQNERHVDLSNIPERDNDNIFNAAFGLRYAPSERIILLGNILVPLNDGGLRSNVAGTVGLAISI